jgi:hypothetical protein
MKAFKDARWILAFLLPLITSTGNASGVVAASFPQFTDTDETIRIERKEANGNFYWQLKGVGGLSTSFLVNDGGPSNTLGIDDGTVTYQANFNSDGHLITQIGSKTLSNFVQISGSLPAGTNGSTSWANQPYQSLLRAELLDTEPTNGTPDSIASAGGFALGFNTHFTGGWTTSIPGLTGGSTGESLWLLGFSQGFMNLANALDGNAGNGTLASLIGSSKIIDGVTSITSVPVPGAVWLFGTGLMTLVAGRRKSIASSRLSA